MNIDPKSSAELNKWLRNLPDRSFPLAIALAIAARYTAAKLDESATAGLPFGETTLTELTLLELKKAVPGLTISSISAVEEARVGADWEFWIEGVNCWFGFLVQAKKSKRAGQDNRSKTTYDLGYRISKNPDGYQVDALLAASKAQNLPAIYALYNNPYYGKKYVRDSCAEQGLPKGLDGVTAVAAQEAHDLLLLGKSRHTAVDVGDTRHHARPWSCIAGCPVARSCSGEFTTRYYSLQLMRSHFPESTPYDDQAFRTALAVYSLHGRREAHLLANSSCGIRQSPPEYVLQLRDKQGPIELPTRRQYRQFAAEYMELPEAEVSLEEPDYQGRWQETTGLVPYDDRESPAPRNLAILWREEPEALEEGAL